MQHQTNAPDPRYFQLVFQLIFLSYGILWLHWEANWVHYLTCISGCLFFNYSMESFRQRKFLPLVGKHGWMQWGFSVMISAASLCLLLKTNHWYTALLSAFLTVTSKYVLRIHGKHLFNPSAFGIVATVLITGDAWLSPGQWGSDAVIFFSVITLGTIVVTRVQKLDVSMAFLITYMGLLFWRQVLVLGWPADYFFHSLCTGSLLLFSFFMISDPKTSPALPAVRIVWAMLIAVVAFYLSAFRWQNNTPIGVLVLAGLLVPVLDTLFRSDKFQWKPTHISSIYSTINF